MNLHRSQPIGIFDSGIGGLTVANAVSKHLPNEQIIYFGDTAHLPYGDKSVEAIQQYSLKISDFLLSKNCKLILIACNTASAAAYEILKTYLDGKALLINVIDPVVQAVAIDSSISKVGIIATKGTIRSGIYEKKLHAINPKLETVSLATQLLAPMIEAGFYNNSVSQAIINNYLAYPDFQDVQAMILACTHYPLIKKEIEFFYHNRIKIFDSTDLIPVAIAKILETNQIANNSLAAPHEFYVSDYTESFEQTTKIFFGEKIQLQHFPLWD